MALPNSVLERLPPALRKNGLIFTSDGENRRSFLRPEPETAPFTKLDHNSAERSGPAWGRLQPGGVTEVVSRGGSWGTSLGLSAIREAQTQALARGEGLPLIGMVTWGASLFAPGLLRRKIQLERVLIVEPQEEMLERVVLRLVESRLFSLIVIDLVGVPGSSCEIFLGGWVRILRRFQLALEGSERSVLLLTNENSRRSLPLPVSERWELRRSGPREVALRSVKPGGDWKTHSMGLVGPLRPRMKGETAEVRHGAA